MTEINALKTLHDEAQTARIEMGCYFENCVIFASTLTVEGQNSLTECYIEGSVRLGRGTYANKDAQLRHVETGRFCSIADGVIISPNKHPTRWLSTHPAIVAQSTADDRLAVGDPRVVIGNDVWLGTRSIVMGGLSIGDGAIIAAGSVLTKSVAPYEIVGGVPARVMGSRFDQSVINAIREAAWWKYDVASLGKTDMSDIMGLLDIIATKRADGELVEWSGSPMTLVSLNRQRLDNILQ